VNRWTIFVHPLVLDQLVKLIEAVEREKAKNPKQYRQGANAKVLAAIVKLILDDIPADPADPRFRQGGTLGADRKHWFRAKFGGGRFRLFFRFSSKAKIIVLAWVDDDRTLLTYGSKADAYRVFGKMLDAGNPPDAGRLFLPRRKPPRRSSGPPRLWRRPSAPDRH
jgi:toxin YhaV